ncbi:hypothetical protein DUNSADRAFT_14242 [Dunaliella salina]|uniref:ABC1 atypical kinase-like domain-containing protein n=1 Tax=Dunaliella salina TaxID=3046 RepID=A0ABQ7G7R3_DUNSA|nr:hypothetical protein DUNSADRAFT_14242 [Dunaliella salina]|eukprot:KAF5830641.1 hypothetical protein DUNSADRAFT_14242 [Dunaliella salina]
MVMAFGVQILLEGIFHTDPHPGNLMAAPDPAGDGMRVAILDWGQMKQLTHNERVRYALLVVAMASRDGDLLRATLAELGVRIENCDDSFAEVRC